ncbi:pyridine nucleotide-disulfide oxidoreductase/dicluster-binding protein [Desulfotomaculum sp. 1211_IL3151]|uniref:pyridine nucleotide-disulfide oxidoreductase/dicluster-binding protein n=1 Tax=Desulfotomaculum sp. 1211_IL3151 TaxID=3084055 RepID=UPI002FDB0FCF
MDHKRIVELEGKCTRDQPAACSAACPVHVDVRAMLAAIKAGRFTEAFNIYSKSVPFPRIIGSICDHPCQKACKRGEAGDALAIARLERACVQVVPATEAKVTAPSRKEQRVAVVGAGLSGLTAAHDLAKKGYPVTLFETGSSLGGRLKEFRAEELPPQMVSDDLAVLAKLGVVLQLHTTVGRDISFAALCQDYDAVYLGTGTVTPEFKLPLDQQGQLMIDPITFATAQEGVFAGGTLGRGGSYSPIGSVADGRRAAISIDRFLQGVSLTAVRANEGPFETRLFTSTQGVTSLPAVPLGHNSDFYNEEEASQEASRCLQCECLECIKSCEYLAHFKGYPKQYIRQINHNLKMVMGRREANTLINSCSLCGLCEAVCPEGLNLGEFCQEARGEMVKKGKMPPSAHDFPLRDMAFSNGEQCVLTRHQPGYQTSSYLFFPGCQLSACAPGHVEKVYDYLMKQLNGGVGLMLRCCGAPAEWSGRQELFEAELKKMKDQWEELGKPKVILACSTCHQMFKKYLPEMELISLWQLYHQYGLPQVSQAQRPALVAVHDACTSRREGQMHGQVREIILKLGCQIEELPTSRDKTECCGYGGLMQFANRDLADAVIKRRIDESEADYLVYCAICRDNFAAKGKKTYHLLDLIYGEGDPLAPAKRGPGYSQRRENRVRLKNKLIKNRWGDKMTEERDSYEKIKLIIPEDIQELMENRLILVEDVQRVIDYAERTGNKMLDGHTGHYLARFRPVSVTYWVEYLPQGDGFMIYNTYSHRMEIIEEVKE